MAGLMDDNSLVKVNNYPSEDKGLMRTGCDGCKMSA